MGDDRTKINLDLSIALPGSWVNGSSCAEIEACLHLELNMHKRIHKNHELKTFNPIGRKE